jgi:glucose-1-phosphate thymidylyltransferase
VPLIAHDERVLVGLPDTIWFPEDGLSALPPDVLSFLLFPVERPEFFDAVVMAGDDRVSEIQVKQPGALSNWVWGAFGMPGRVLHELHALWRARGQQDEYVGTLVNAWLARGGVAHGAAAGETYVDVGTLHGYHEAIQALREQEHERRLVGGGEPAATH